MIMTEQLREAFERARQLPDTAQNALAERILEEIEEQEWEAIINKPCVHNKLIALAEEAWKEYEAGETEEGGFAVERASQSTVGSSHRRIRGLTPHEIIST